MGATDDLGTLGQMYCGTILGHVPSDRSRSWFTVWMLDGKFPTFDFLVTLVGAPACYFFVQVKATRKGYRPGRGGRRLRVDVSGTDAAHMAATPAPVYLVGVDIPGDTAYLLSMHDRGTEGIGAMPTRHVFDPGMLGRLWNEVRDYWVGRDMILRDSVFG